MKLQVRQYILSIGLLGSILLSQFAVASGQAPSAFTSGGLASYPLPDLAVVGSTVERRNAWDNLSVAQKSEINSKINQLVSSSRATPRPDRTVTLSFANNLGVVSESSARGSAQDSSDFFGQVTPRTFPTPDDTQIFTDDDVDGLPDEFENSLANGFTPHYYVSGGENAGTGFARFNNSVPQTVSQTFGSTPPISHYRVKGLGFFSRPNDPAQYGVIQLDYLTLWNKDDGLVGGGGCVITPIINTAEVGSHALDNERSALLVAAPIVNGTYSLNLQSYKLYEVFTAAHEGTFFDQSFYYNLADPFQFDSHIILALSKSKHATYAFDPNNYPIVPEYAIAATYSSIHLSYYYGK